MKNSTRVYLIAQIVVAVIMIVLVSTALVASVIRFLMFNAAVALLLFSVITRKLLLPSINEYKAQFATSHKSNQTTKLN